MWATKKEKLHLSFYSVPRLTPSPLSPSIELSRIFSHMNSKGGKEGKQMSRRMTFYIGALKSLWRVLECLKHSLKNSRQPIKSTAPNCMIKSRVFQKPGTAVSKWKWEEGSASVLREQELYIRGNFSDNFCTRVWFSVVIPPIPWYWGVMPIQNRHN